VSSPIPIQNVYYLLLYAWDKLPEGEMADVSKLESQELVDLFASVMIKGINHLLRRGLDQSYLSHGEEIPGIRGRINIGITARRMLAPHGRAFCEFDELSVDTLPNRILKSTVRKLIRSSTINKVLRNKLRGVYRELGGISDMPLTRSAFRTVQLHSNNRFYRFLLKICELVLDLSLMDEGGGEYKFQDFIRDEKSMARLFENFVFNFYRIERPDLSIRKERIYWQALSSNDPSLSFLPTMETDISVRSQSKTLIIDAKFYQKTFQKYYDKQSIHSGNLYQVFSYLKNLEPKGGNDASASGMLLYPAIGEKVRLSYELPGHTMHICTVDLARSWPDIRRELLGLLDGLNHSDLTATQLAI
jgi:5-methylcytosine-specific restriction enzyme subunit McrC